MEVNDEKIKIFLKIKNPKVENKEYYKTSLDKKVFLLAKNPKIKKEEEINEKYTFDKIFNDNNENSYIYEEIMLNCINESINGIHYTFISYGDSNSENKDIIFGKNDCYDNINSRGIFPRFLESYILKISSDKHLNENLALNVSYLMINGNNLIDLSKFIGMDNNEIAKLSESDLINNSSVNIDKSSLSKIKKVPCEKVSDVLFSLTKFFDTLLNLEMDEIHLLFNSYFTFIIYINDNNGKLVSSISFIILGCNNINNQIYISELNNTKLDIINNIKHNKKKITNQSKLISLLYNISFNENNIKRYYRLIGTIYPDEDSFLNVKETINFLLNFKAISNKDKKVHYSILEKKPKDDKRDFIIKDLESKIKVQEKMIEDLKNSLEHKTIKTEMLKENYKKQFESLKEIFNFEGNFNNLLNNVENSKEKKFTQLIRESLENTYMIEYKIKELKNKIINIKDEEKKILTIEQIKNTDEALIKLNTEIKEEKLAYEKRIKLRNEYWKKIQVFKEKNNLLKQLLEKFKEDNTIKEKIINNLPSNFNIKKYEENEEKIINDFKKYFKKEFNEIETNKNKENNIIKKKYENLIKQKENQMKNIENEINKNLKMNEGNYIKEIIELYKTIDNLITSYKKIFEEKKIIDVKDIKNFPHYLNLKEEFDKEINKYEKNVNRFKFPILFKELDEKGIERKKTKIIVYYQKEKEIPKNNLALKNKLNSNFIPTNFLEKKYKKIFEDIILDNKIFNQMSETNLMNYYKKIKGKLFEIEEFNSKYINYSNFKYDEKSIKSNEEIIKDLKNKLEKIKNLINDYSTKTNDLQNIISTHKKMTDKLSIENLLLKKKLREKNINSKITFFPNYTLYETKNKKTDFSSLNISNLPNSQINFHSPNVQYNSFKRPITSTLKKNTNNNTINIYNPYLKFPELN